MAERPKLTYFNLSGNRGEECRLALHVGGADFDDHRIGGSEFRELKPDLPFGSLPIFERSGEPVLAQTNAILRYIGREYGLYPQDAWLAAHVDSVMDAVEDARGQLSRTVHMSDEDEKKAAREELARGFLPTWAANMERYLRDPGPFVLGSEICIADFKVFMLVRWIENGILDHVPPELFRSSPKLQRIFGAVGEHPKVVQWYETH